MTEQIKKLISLLELSKTSLNIYKTNFKKLFLISLIFFGILGILTTLIAPATTDSKIQSQPAINRIKPILILNPILYFSLTVAIFLLAALGQISLISAVKKIPGDWQIKDAIGDGSKIFWPFVWLNILSAIIILVGFLLFIIPGIIFTVWYSLAAYVLIFEDRKGWPALKRSKEIIKGYWWPVFGRLLLLILAALGASFILGWIPYIGSLTLQILFPPFSTIYSYLIYKNLREIRNE